MHAAHLEAIRQIVASAGLDAIALVPGPNMVYLTGQEFHLMERPLIGFYPPAGDPVFILPTLEQDKLAAPPYPIQLFAYTDTDGPDGAFRAALDALRLGGGRLGVEGLRMRYSEAQLIARHAPGVIITAAPLGRCGRNTTMRGRVMPSTARSDRSRSVLRSVTVSTGGVAGRPGAPC